MNFFPFADLFLQPLLTGLCFAILLPLLGCYLRLRHEWLAALAYSQTGAAGALGAMALELPLAGGGLIGAMLAAVGKQLGAKSGQGTPYALLLLGGWGVSVLLVANLPMAERMGHALFDGQLYFSESNDLWFAAGWLLLAGLALWKLSTHLLLAQLYPEYFAARHLPGWPIHLGFDLLAATSLALATMSLGVMAAFALIFIPAWLAFSLGKQWRQALWLSFGFGLVIYLASFALAIQLDQPFGPILALCLISGGVLGHCLAAAKH